MACCSSPGEGRRCGARPTEPAAVEGSTCAAVAGSSCATVAGKSCAVVERTKGCASGGAAAVSVDRALAVKGITHQRQEAQLIDTTTKEAVPCIPTAHAGKLSSPGGGGGCVTCALFLKINIARREFFLIFRFFFGCGHICPEYLMYYLRASPAFGLLFSLWPLRENKKMRLQEARRISLSLLALHMSLF